MRPPPVHADSSGRFAAATGRWCGRCAADDVQWHRRSVNPGRWGTHQCLCGHHAGANDSLDARPNCDPDRQRAVCTSPTNARADAPDHGASYSAVAAPNNGDPHAHGDGGAAAANDVGADYRSTADGTAHGTADTCAGAWSVHPGRQRRVGDADNNAIQSGQHRLHLDL